MAPPVIERVRASNAAVVDLFCGAGGLAHGFKLEGFTVAAGVDVDPACRYAFEHNNMAPFYERDVSQLSAVELLGFFGNRRRILVGCAPCQPFSTYNQKNQDPQWSLVDIFADLITETEPDVVSMENVPRLLDFKGGTLFQRFVKKLRKADYHVTKKVVYLPTFGLAQRRTRLVVLASKHGLVRLERPKLTEQEFRTVAQEIGELPPLDAGATDPVDRLHQASRLSELNLKRLRASLPGGTWRDWDEALISNCHRRSPGKGYGAVYGRMQASLPSPTITTEFYNYGSGRFGHPYQDRALSLREGALLQSFPPDYEFVDPEGPINVRKLGQLIGNAVPVMLGRVIARAVQRHLDRVFA